jgi:hypothetical protein
MAVDLTELRNVMQTALLRDLGDEVELIFRYGSQVKGNTHAYSDLDISYVPAHESTGHHITVMVDDLLCDLYPIRWSQLESMANFENVSSTVLLNYQILYQKSDAAAARIGALADQLRASLQPTARPTMLGKACSYFQRIGYPYYLLREQAANGHTLAALQQSQQILNIIFHTLAIFNQRCIDTRKLDQVLALPQLPADFAETVDRIKQTTNPDELLRACDQLLTTTRALLLAEQQRQPHSAANFRAAFGAGYPELKGDLQHLLLACERADLLEAKRLLVSLYHEVALAVAQGATGVRYSGFNALADYEQAFAGLGFPPLLPYVANGDFVGLHKQCLAFDEQLQQFMAGHNVKSYAFATIEELQHHLEVTAD